MATMFVRHEVSDFAQWKRAYDAFHDTEVTMGVLADAVYRAADNPNDVTVTHDFDSLAAAQAFAGSDELKTAMKGAGVTGAPNIWFAERA
jgi:hypothetical protein